MAVVWCGVSDVVGCRVLGSSVVSFQVVLCGGDVVWCRGCGVVSCVRFRIMCGVR